jgi:hypothetical protein
MRILVVLSFLMFFYFVYGFYIAQMGPTLIAQDLKRESPRGFHDYRGVTNVRTDLSSGSSEPAEVISEAKKAGLDFLILTDENQTEKARNAEGYHGNLLVMVESEYSYLDMRLLHYSGLKDSAPRDPNDTRLYFTDLLSQNSSAGRDNIVVMAHPFVNGSPTWTGDFPLGLDGVEILNPKSVSQSAWVNSKINVLWSLVCYPFNPNLAFLRLFQEPTDETALWDKILQQKKIYGYAGADASARAIPFASYLMKFPSYQKSFEIATNHVLMETELNADFHSDRQKIVRALKQGQFYFSLDLLGDPKGFNAFVQDHEKVHMMGSTIKFNKHLRLVTKLPVVPKDFYEVIVYRNGERDLTANQPEINYEIKSPGVYRVAVRVSAFLPPPDGKKWMTWIYTNPFFIN